MMILAIDPGASCGFAIGRDDLPAPAEMFSHRLAKAGAGADEVGGNIGPVLRDLIRRVRPDIIVAERYMDPAGSKSSTATVGALLLAGGIFAIAKCYGIPVGSPAAGAIRQYLCGQQYASKAARAIDKLATKRMVRDRLILLGALPKDFGEQFDVSDAVAVWTYWSMLRGHRKSEFVMF